MDATAEQSAELATLALTDPTAFANKFVELLTGEEPSGEMSNSAAGKLDEEADYRKGTSVGDITVKCEELEGGSEGGGEAVSRVYSVSQGRNIIAYIKTTGCYYSHDGTYWDDSFTRVYPQRYIAVRYTEEPRKDEV